MILNPGSLPFVTSGSRLKVALTTVTAALLVTAGAHSIAQETVLYSFGSGTDGVGPSSGLVADAAGNFYGTTPGGGGQSAGTVYELSPVVGGGWTETVIFAFSGSNGSAPAAALVWDNAGNLYGTTETGGAYGAGTVFELSPPTAPGQPWVEQVLYGFATTDGADPQGSLIFDTLGNLYGTTRSGGAYGWGTVFELMPDVGSGWTEIDLHDFDQNGVDGYTPLSNLILNADGSLYGTTEYGSIGNHGVVFQLIPNSGGPWTESLVHPFPRFKPNGAYPLDNGILYGGNFFITTSQGGAYGAGTVVMATPGWTLPWWCAVLHSFNGANSSDGFDPEAGVIADPSGILYGTTFAGGANAGGTVFQLSKIGDLWTENILHDFGSSSTDGINPEAGLIFDSAGNLYGTTAGGGEFGGGTVFEITGQPTSTSVVSSLNPSTYGQPIMFSATVSGTAGLPSGTITFMNGAAKLSAIKSTDGSASYTTSRLGAGSNSITAAYGGNGLFSLASASPTLAQVVTKATTSVTLTSSSNPSTTGQPVTFTASVAPQFSGVPPGKVTFLDGTAILGTITLSAGAASLTTSALAYGAHNITAKYLGGANFLRSSAALTQNED